MKLVFRTSFFLLCALLISTSTFAGKKEYSKTIKKEFPIVANGVVNIQNKYGKINVRTWDRDRVKVEVRITVLASSEKSAQGVFDRIAVNFSNSGDYVKAETNIESKKSNWWSWTDDSDSDFSIDYQVQVPKSLNLELSNKYGDIAVPSMDGWAKLWVKYGNFSVAEVSDVVVLDVAYGNGSLKRGKDVNIDTKYSNLSVEEAIDMEISSKHSNLQIKKAREITCNTKYDNYVIGEISEISNTGKYDNFEVAFANDVKILTKYSHLRFKKVGEKLDLNMEYGDAIINQLESGFSNVNLDGRHTDFKLSVARGTAFQVDADASYAGVRYPSNMIVTHEIEKGSSLQVKGHLGSKNTSKVVKARLSYGGLRIDQN